MMRADMDPKEKNEFERIMFGILLSAGVLCPAERARFRSPMIGFIMVRAGFSSGKSEIFIHVMEFR